MSEAPLTSDKVQSPIDLKVDAPAFVPSSLKVDAPVFVPARLRVDAPVFIPTVVLPNALVERMDSFGDLTFIFENPSELLGNNPVGALASSAELPPEERKLEESPVAKVVPEEEMAPSLSSLSLTLEDSTVKGASTSDGVVKGPSPVYPRTIAGSGQQRLPSDDYFLGIPALLVNAHRNDDIASPSAPASGPGAKVQRPDDVIEIIGNSIEMERNLAGERGSNHAIDPIHFNSACAKFLSAFKNKLKKRTKTEGNVPFLDRKDLAKDFYIEDQQKFLRIVFVQDFKRPTKLKVLTCFYVDYSQCVRETYSNEANFKFKLKRNEVSRLDKKENEQQN